MSAQKSNQQSTSQTSSQGEERGQRGQQTTLARRGGALPSLPSLLLDPFAIFDDSPFSIISRIQQEMNRVMGQSRAANASGRGDDLSTAAWTPAVDIAVQDGNLVVAAELPGLNENDVRVEIDNDVLVIQGERRDEREEGDGGIRRIERRYGRFYRAIALPDGVNPEQARAEFRNGVLYVTVPLPQDQNKVRQIPVQTSTSQQERGQGGEQKTTEAPAQKAA